MQTIRVLYIFLILGIFGIKAQSFYNGEFVVRKTLTYYDSLTTPENYLAYANLYVDSVNKNESWHSENIGNIYFNSTGLLYNSQINTYHDTVQRTTNEGMQWIVSSSNSVITSFTAICVDTFPTIQSVRFFPDTLKKSDSLYIYFGEVLNADEIELTMYDGVLRIYFPFNRIIDPTSLFVSVPSSDLDSLEGEVVTLTLGLIKYEYQSYNGLNFKFIKRYNIVKSLVLTN